MKRLPESLFLAWTVTATVSVWLLLSLYQDRQGYDDQAQARMLTLARLVGEHADSIMDSTELMLDSTLATIGPVGVPWSDPLALEQAHDALETAVERTAAVDNLLIADASGRLRTTSLKHTVGGSMLGEPYFEALQRDPHDRTVAATVRGRSTGRWGMVLARPLREDGRFAGVLAAHIGLEKTFLSIYRQIGIGPGTAIAVWNPQGTLLLRQPFVDRLIGTAVANEALKTVIDEGLDETAQLTLSPTDSTQHMTAVRRIGRHPLIVSVSQSQDEYLAPWRDMLWRTLIPVSAMLLGCLVLTRSVRSQRGAEKRLTQLIDAAPLGVVCFDSDARGQPLPFAANNAARQHLFRNGGSASAMPDLSALGIESALHAATRKGSFWQARDVRLDTANGLRRLDLRLFGIGDGQAGLLIEDATDRLAAEEQMQATLARWQAALEDADHGVRDWHLATGEMVFSERWQRQLGYAREPLDNTLEAWEACVHPADLPRCRADLEQHLEGLSASYRSEHRMRCADGSYRWVLERGRVVERSDDGRALRMVITQTDISPLRQLEDNLSLWAQVFERAQQGIIITDAKARIVEVNDAYCTSSGYDRSRLIGNNPSMMQSGHQDAAFYREMWNQLLADGHWTGELLNRRADGSFFAQNTTLVVIRDRDGEPVYFVGYTDDVSELRASQERLALLNRQDPLTELPNRNQLAEQMRAAIAVSQRNGYLMAVCALDLDHFKPINERWGPEEGDRILVEVARRLEHTLHAGDSAARLGGDEFVLLLTGLDSALECDQRLHEVLASLRKDFARPDGKLRLTASIGATLYPLDGGDPDTLLRHANQALYAAKQDGRDCCRLFDTDQDQRLRVHRRAVSELRAALEQHQLELRYQPKIALESGDMVGVEALLRWQHPERGMLMPIDFIAEINDDDLLVDIGEWCLKTAVAQASKWHSAGHSIPVSVNVTAGQILRPGFADMLFEVLKLHPQLPPALLEIEILESAALNDLPRVIELMERCADIDVRFALDDFGTGYASLTYLKHLPAETLKIDQSFVRDILEDAEHRAIVEGVLSLTRVFGRTAIAEGVESIEHGVALIRLGATHAQGFAIAGALRPDELLEWAEDWRNPPEWTRESWRYRNQGNQATSGSNE